MLNLLAASSACIASLNCFSGAKPVFGRSTIRYGAFLIVVCGLTMAENTALAQGEPLTTDSSNFFVRGFAFAFILWAFGFGLRLVRALTSPSRLADV